MTPAPDGGLREAGPAPTADWSANCEFRVRRNCRNPDGCHCREIWVLHEQLAAACAEVERVRAERDAYAEVLSDCAAALRQVPAHLLPGTVDMPVVAALHAPMASGESRDAVIAAAERIGARAGTGAEARIRVLEETPRRARAALDAATRMDAILLMAGEMTAQERRTARAVAHGIAVKVRAALGISDGDEFV